MSRSGDRSYRRGVGFYQIRGRDREIAPTEEGLGIKKSRDREIAPTKSRRQSAVSNQKEWQSAVSNKRSRSGDRSYSWGGVGRD